MFVQLQTLNIHNSFNFTNFSMGRSAFESVFGLVFEKNLNSILNSVKIRALFPGTVTNVLFIFYSYRQFEANLVNLRLLFRCYVNIPMSLQFFPKQYNLNKLSNYIYGTIYYYTNKQTKITKTFYIARMHLSCYNNNNH